MELAYKEETAQERLLAYWANECIARPAICVTAPRRSSLPGPAAPAEPATLRERWTDCAYRIAAADAGMRATFFGGEAMPSFWPNLGPGWAATFFGSEPEFRPETVWFGQIAADWRRYDIAFDERGAPWELAKRLTREAQEAFAGKALVGITDLGGVTDILASLRGTPELLQDLTDATLHPAILQARDLIRRTWQSCYEELFEIVDGPKLGSIQWDGVWGPGRMYAIQSDMCCMVSPRMFEWFVAPELEALCIYLEQSIYHLDGPGAVRHLERLLAMEPLQGIQWIPGAGAPSAVDWMPMLQRIQQAGKRLDLYESPQHVERLVRELRAEGLLIHTSVASEEEARDMLRLAEGWCSDKRG